MRAASQLRAMAFGSIALVAAAGVAAAAHGRVRIKRKDGDFVLRVGDVYYLERGHVPVFEEDTEILEFRPKREYQMTVDVVAKNMSAAQTTKS